MPTQKINSPEQVNDLTGGISTGTLDARYLKLDASNDPVTGFLEIKPTSNGVRGLNIETMGDTSSFEVTQRATGSVGVGSSVFTLTREPSGDSAPTFTEPMMYLSQSRGSSGTISGGLLRYDSDGNTRVGINPSVQGTGTIAFIDGDFTLSPDGKLLLLKNHGTTKFYVNASGTAYSNDEPLIKEAPINSGTYSRKNAGWTQELSGRMFLPFNVYQPITVFPITPAISPISPYIVPLDRTITLIKITHGANVVTTNNGSNYWKFDLKRISDGSIVATVNTSAISADTWTLINTTSFSPSSIGTSDIGLYIDVSTVGSPGNLFYTGALMEISV